MVTVLLSMFPVLPDSVIKDYCGHVFNADDSDAAVWSAASERQKFESQEVFHIAL